MSWKKHFRVVAPTKERPSANPLHGTEQDGRFGASTTSKYASYLPEVYAGHPNRIQRYYQYDDMDRDSDVNAALDTIADFCTQSEEQQENPFEIVFNSEATEPERKVLTAMLTKWVKLNRMKAKLWWMFRKAIKYGDAFFLRDPETSEWLWLDEFSVLMVKVDEEQGKKPEEYIIRGLDYFKQGKFASKPADMGQYGAQNGQQGYNRGTSASSVAGSFSMAGSHNDMRRGKPGQDSSQDLHVVKAEHIIHLSLSAEMDIHWPFGQSVLDPIFKTFKQKELLEDALIIYRVQRAPERRVFYIDTGSMPPPRAAEYINAVKNELHQRRIPNRTGGGASILDGAYNPLSMMEDLFFAQSAEGRGSRVETLPGGDNLGEIGDVDYFNNKLARGMRIPPSYLSMGSENKAMFNDGKVGQAAVEEFRFAKYCMRLQSLLSPVFDAEFKKYLRDDGADGIDPSIFELNLLPPVNFAKYRQMEVDQMQVGIYTQLADNKKLSERWKQKRFLNMSEDDIIENETMWKEENAAKLKKATGTNPAEDGSDVGLAGVGIRPGGGPMDLGPMDEPPTDDMGDGADAGAGDAGAAGAPGGAPAGGGAAPTGAAPAGGPTL